MNDFKLFGRSPTLWIAVLTSAILLVGTFGFKAFSGEQAGLLVAVVTAAGGALTAFVTRPIQPAAFSGLVGAVVALLTSYGLNFTPEQVATFNAVIVSLLALLTYGNVSPIETMLTKASLEPTASAAAHEANAGNG